MRTKVLSVILSLCMIFTIMPITAFAADQTELDISQGNIVITDDGVSIDGVATYANNANGYIITQTDPETATSNTIKVEAETANITIEDINIKAANGSAFFISPTSTVELTISGANTLTSGYGYAGLWVPTGATVTIQSTDGSVADSLTAKGGETGAGIGGSAMSTAGDNGANCGTVNIKSGKIIANGEGYGSAGIGGGNGSNGGNITISAEEGGSTTVTATGGGNGAGIGGGKSGKGGVITILSKKDSSTTVKAIGGNYGAGIGSGDYGKIDKITISAEEGGSTNVEAMGGGSGGAGVGGGDDGSCGAIKIIGSTVVAKGYRDAGIGNNTDSVVISNSTITATGSSAVAASEVDFDYTDGYKWRTSNTATFTFSDKLVYTSTSNDNYLEVAPGIAITGIELDESTLALNVGETDTLTATIAPDNATNKAITWTSSDTSVATVDENGEITAIGAGTALITATTANGMTATCTVTATEVDVESITLDKTALSLTVGDSDELNATITPENATNKTIVWSSSDTDVATVENGTITAVNDGEATITATAANGKTATCVVTVTVPVTGIELDEATLALNIGDSEALTATITPESASDKTIIWTSSDESVATVDENGQVVAIGVGEATITATSGDMTATCEITVTEPTPEETNGITGFLRMIKMILELIIYIFGLFAG